MAEDAVVRIKKITPTTGDYASITVKHMVKSNGDIEVLDNGGGANVKISLSKTLYPQYKFDQSVTPTGPGTHPICVYKVTPGTTNCLPGQMPAGGGWGYRNNDGQSFTLVVPQFPNGEQYDYMLFMTKTSGGTQKPVIIDPKIGCCEVNLSFFQQLFDRFNVSTDVGIGIFIAVAVALGFGMAKILR